jgi:hypothetical protein
LRMRWRAEISVLSQISQANMHTQRCIPRSGQNPKILGRDDTEVIRYLITIGECQGSCRLDYVMILFIDDAASLAVKMSGISAQP